MRAPRPRAPWEELAVLIAVAGSAVAFVSLDVVLMFAATVLGLVAGWRLRRLQRASRR